MRLFEVKRDNTVIGAGVQFDTGMVGVEWYDLAAPSSEVFHKIEDLHALQLNPLDFTFKSEIVWPARGEDVEVCEVA